MREATRAREPERTQRAADLPTRSPAWPARKTAGPGGLVLRHSPRPPLCDSPHAGSGRAPAVPCYKPSPLEKLPVGQALPVTVTVAVAGASRPSCRQMTRMAKLRGSHGAASAPARWALVEPGRAGHILKDGMQSGSPIRATDPNH